MFNMGESIGYSIIGNGTAVSLGSISAMALFFAASFGASTTGLGFLLIGVVCLLSLWQIYKKQRV